MLPQTTTESIPQTIGNIVLIPRPDKSTNQTHSLTNISFKKPYVSAPRSQHSKFTPTQIRLPPVDTSPVDDDESGNFETDTPYVWGSREGLRSGRRRHKIILLKGRNPQTVSTSTPESSSLSNESNDDSTSTSDQPQSTFSTEEVEEDDNQSIYPIKNAPHPPTLKVGYRKSFEDAPGAGRFIPRRKSTKFPPLNLNLSRSLEDVEEKDVEKGNKTLDDRSGDEYDVDENEAVTLCKDPTGKTGICEEYFLCSVLYAESAGRINLQDYKCKLRNEEIGICCPVFEEDSKVGRSTSGRAGGQRG